MFVSLPQRFIFRVSRCVGQPLQSRADQNTRRVASGGQPGLMPRETRAASAFLTGRRQTNQETRQQVAWLQVQPDRKMAVRPESRRGLSSANPQRLSSGDTL